MAITEDIDGRGAPAPAPVSSSPPAPSLDALMPAAIAEKAARVGADKAGMALVPMFSLAVLAGAFIALGAMFATVVTTGSADIPYGIARLAGGLSFCLGLILVVVAGAELFTGNNLIAMAWAEHRVSVGRMLRNWGVVYAGNLVGSVATVALVYAGKQYASADAGIGLNALKIAETKTSLGFGQAIALGILCNALVCLAVWLSYSARSVTDKVLAVIFPITAFVAAGFEHSVANMYFLPMGLLLKEDAPDSFWTTAGASAADYPHVTLERVVFSNLLPVTAGNIIGGSVMVGLVYWLVYRRGQRG